MASIPRRIGLRAQRALALVGAIAVACGAVAACGSNGSSSASSSSGSGRKDLTAITLGYPNLTIHLLPFQVAIDQGFFAKHGLKVKLVSTNNSQTTVAALTSGSVQFAGVGSSGVLSAASKGAPVISVLAQDDGVPQDLMVSKKFAKAHGLTANSPMTLIAKDLGHSTFGTNGLTDQGLARELLGAYGVGTSGVKFAQLGSQGALATSVTSGAVDAEFTSPPSSYQLRAANQALLLGDAARIPSWPSDIYQYVLAANRNYVSAHKSITDEVVAAVHEAIIFIKEHPGQVEGSAAKVLTGNSASVLQQSVPALNWASNGTQTQAGWNATIKFNIQTGGVTAGTKATDGQTWTNTYYSS